VTLDICVISKNPPGGRCTLYAGYAQALQLHLPANLDLRYSDHQDAHGEGFPSFLIDDEALQPADGVILMPDDILAALQQRNIPIPDIAILTVALEAPLNDMLEASGE